MGGGDTSIKELNGKVIQSFTGSLEGIVVVLDRDFAHPVSTDASGSFTFKDLNWPYDLTVAGKDPNGFGLTVTLVGISTDMPRIALGTLLGAPPSSNLSGHLSGPAFPLPAGQSVILTGAPGGPMAYVGDDGSFSGDYLWFDTPSVANINLFGILMNGSSFLKTGSASLTLHDGVPQSALSLAITQPVTTSTTTLTVDGNAYNFGTTATLAMAKFGGEMMPVGVDMPIDSAFALPVEGGAVQVEAENEVGDRVSRRIPAVVGGTTHLSLPTATELSAIAPADGSTGVSRTPTLVWSTPRIDLDYYIMVMGDDSTHVALLPGLVKSFSFSEYDLATLGFGLKPNAKYTWTIIGTGGGALDAESVATGVRGVFALGTLDSWTRYETRERSFTTAP